MECSNNFNNNMTHLDNSLNNPKLLIAKSVAKNALAT